MKQTDSVKTQTMKFLPFKAWRYNPRQATIGEVMAPPYDVISPEEQEELYRRSEFNCIRLILNKIRETDTEADNRYTRARDHFKTWQSDGLLIREEKPAYYLYQQIFKDPYTAKKRSRLALFWSLKLVSFSENIVIPHEKTLDKPKADRRKLLEATRTNFSPIFGLYEDKEKNIAGYLKTVMKESPVYQAKDNQKVEHKLWIIQEKTVTEALARAFEKQKVYIADGHHRYQTALDYAYSVRGQAKDNPLDGRKPSDYVLMALVEFQDPGLLVMPTHRILKNMSHGDMDQYVHKLKDFFCLEELSEKELKAKLKKDEKKGLGVVSFGLILRDGKKYYLTPKNLQSLKDFMPEGHSEVWYSLDVNVLNFCIFEHLWGLDDTKRQNLLEFTHDDLEVSRAFESGEVDAAFILKAPVVEILREIGKKQELMPQKSTYFYPKLASGFLFHQHQEAN